MEDTLVAARCAWAVAAPPAGAVIAAASIAYLLLALRRVGNCRQPTSAVDGRPALPPEAVPELVGRDGRFADHRWRMAVKLYCSAAARQRTEAELRAQLTVFHRTGLALDHANGHQCFAALREYAA